MTTNKMRDPGPGLATKLTDALVGISLIGDPVMWQKARKALQEVLDAHEATRRALPDGFVLVPVEDAKNAERYKWLRGEVQGPHIPMAQVVWKLHCVRNSPNWTNLADGLSLDEHIDAMLQAAPRGSE